MSFRVLSHTADTGIEATADSLANLVAELGTGMFSLMGSVKASADLRWIEMTVSADSVEDLVMDALSELLYRSEVEDLVFGSLVVAMAPDRLAMTVEAGGAPPSEVEVTGPPIKAVTYHDLVAEERDDGWYGRVYFDV